MFARYGTDLSLYIAYIAQHLIFFSWRCKVDQLEIRKLLEHEIRERPPNALTVASLFAACSDDVPLDQFESRNPYLYLLVDWISLKVKIRTSIC